MAGIPKINPRVNRAQIEDQRARERNAALKNETAANLPTSIDRAGLPTLLGLFNFFGDLFRDHNNEKRGQFFIESNHRLLAVVANSFV